MGGQVVFEKILPGSPSVRDCSYLPEIYSYSVIPINVMSHVNQLFFMEIQLKERDAQ